MVPETRNYYTSGQITGLVGGVKGVYDLETLMKQGFPGMESKGKGTAYYLALHFALGLLILTVIIGNVAMLLAGKRARSDGLPTPQAWCRLPRHRWFVHRSLQGE
jgi:hypothetical protein